MERIVGFLFFVPWDGFVPFTRAVGRAEYSSLSTAPNGLAWSGDNLIISILLKNSAVLTKNRELK